jgi:hypothetical protein
LQSEKGACTCAFFFAQKRWDTKYHHRFCSPKRAYTIDYQRDVKPLNVSITAAFFQHGGLLMPATSD